MKTEQAFPPVFREGSKKSFEQAIEIANLLNEFCILLKEFFIGTFSLSEQGIELRFSNGQEFLLRLEAMNI